MDGGKVAKNPWTANAAVDMPGVPEALDSTRQLYP